MSKKPQTLELYRANLPLSPETKGQLDKNLDSVFTLAFLGGASIADLPRRDELRFKAGYTTIRVSRFTDLEKFATEISYTDPDTGVSGVLTTKTPDGNWALSSTGRPDKVFDIDDTLYTLQVNGVMLPPLDSGTPKPNQQLVQRLFGLGDNQVDSYERTSVVTIGANPSTSNHDFDVWPKVDTIMHTLTSSVSHRGRAERLYAVDAVSPMTKTVDYHITLAYLNHLSTSDGNNKPLPIDNAMVRYTLEGKDLATERELKALAEQYSLNNRAKNYDPENSLRQLIASVEILRDYFRSLRSRDTKLKRP